MKHKIVALEIILFILTAIWGITSIKQGQNITGYTYGICAGIWLSNAIYDLVSKD